MACGNVNNIKIEPANAYWQIEHSFCVDFANATASGLGGQYFTFYKADGTGYYVWFDENNTDSDPAVAGFTAIAVDYAASASASAIATAAQAAIDAVTGVKATLDGTHVIITIIGPADVTSEDQGTASALVLTRLQEGRDVDLGLLDGDIEVSFEETLFEVTAHQTGATAIAELRQGVGAEVTLTLKEADSSKLEEIFAKVAGGEHTPSGGTKLFGWGTSKVGTNTIVESARLILHPVRLDDNDYSEDLCFWKAYPIPESITYSGENPKVVSVRFKAYKDEDRPEAINLFAFGDWTQLSPED